MSDSTTKALADLTRDELNAHAATLGIEHPASFPNKAELIAAIEAAAPESGAGDPEPPADRVETYEATRPNGDRVVVTRNLDSGGHVVRPAGDLGVPMLPGDPNEPQGPEDALGPGPTRGDYRGRIGDATYQPHEGSEPQRPRVNEIGDVAGEKGGVTTAAGEQA